MTQQVNRNYSIQRRERLNVEMFRNEHSLGETGNMFSLSSRRKRECYRKKIFEEIMTGYLNEKDQFTDSRNSENSKYEKYEVVKIM